MAQWAAYLGPGRCIPHLLMVGAASKPCQSPKNKFCLVFSFCPQAMCYRFTLRLTGNFCVVHPPAENVAYVNEVRAKEFQVNLGGTSWRQVSVFLAGQANVNDCITVTWGIQGGIHEAHGSQFLNCHHIWVNLNLFNFLWTDQGGLLPNVWLAGRNVKRKWRFRGQ